jgi:hypothetical protein
MARGQEMKMGQEMRMRTIRSFVLGSAAALVFAFSGPALAQGSIDASTLSDRAGKGAGSGEATGGAQAAHVGAGVTNGSTNGFSGPKKATDARPGEIRTPPLPDKSMCEPYRDTPAHRGCLLVVLRQDGR